MRTKLVLLAVIIVGFLGWSSRAEEPELLLATTTSVQDTGLLDALLPELTKETRMRVRVIAVGSGAALRLGADGNADVVLAHAPAAEEELLKTQVFLSRSPIMENYFVIAGPGADPARVRDATNGADAFRRIAAAKAPYVSRGDDSGTHKREQELLKAAGLAAKPDWPGVLSTGAGMGQTLLVAGEKKAYSLSDVGTYLAFQNRIGLERLTKASDDLRNVYSLLAVNPVKFSGKIHAKEASEFVEWFLRPSTSRKIAEFGRAKYGESLFRPLNLEED